MTRRESYGRTFTRAQVESIAEMQGPGEVSRPFPWVVLLAAVMLAASLRELVASLL